MNKNNQMDIIFNNCTNIKNIKRIHFTEAQLVKIASDFVTKETGVEVRIFPDQDESCWYFLLIDDDFDEDQIKTLAKSGYHLDSSGEVTDNVISGAFLQSHDLQRDNYTHMYYFDY